MRRTGLSKLPLSFWFFLSLLIAYVTYNPWYDISNLMRIDMFWGLKVVIGGFYAGLLLLYIQEGSKSLSPIGVLILLAILGASVATLINWGWLTMGSARYWMQVPVGIALFVALRWNVMYRTATGRVAVTTDDNQEAHGHGS